MRRLCPNVWGVGECIFQQALVDRPRSRSARAPLAEGIVRGYKLGLLTSTDYNNLSQCENLEDIKLYLTGTDYAPFISNEAGPLHTTALVECCTRKLVHDWHYLLENASEPLATFLQYCTYGHMIDNVVLIVTGCLHERDVQDLLDKAHPLGVFDAIATLAVAQNMKDLFRLVLVDTPLAPYFSGAVVYILVCVFCLCFCCLFCRVCCVPFWDRTPATHNSPCPTFPSIPLFLAQST